MTVSADDNGDHRTRNDLFVFFFVKGVFVRVRVQTISIFYEIKITV